VHVPKFLGFEVLRFMFKLLLTTELHIVAATAAMSTTTMMKYLFPLILLCAGFFSVESFSRPHRCFRPKVRVELMMSKPPDSLSLANKVDEIEKNVLVIYKKLNTTQIEIKEEKNSGGKMMSIVVKQLVEIGGTLEKLEDIEATQKKQIEKLMELSDKLEDIEATQKKQTEKLETTRAELAGNIEWTRISLSILFSSFTTICANALILSNA
jgi:hypothetical protein